MFADEDRWYYYGSMDTITQILQNHLFVCRSLIVPYKAVSCESHGLSDQAGVVVDMNCGLCFLINSIPLTMVFIPYLYYGRY